MSYGVIVQLPVMEGHLDDVLAIIESEMDRVRSADGCEAFHCGKQESSNDVWLFEIFESKEYHQNVHQESDEIKYVMSALPEHLTGPWTIHELEPWLSK